MSSTESISSLPLSRPRAILPRRSWASCGEWKLIIKRSQATQANCWYVRHMPVLSASVPVVLLPGPKATLIRKGVVQVSTRQLPFASSSSRLHSELPQCSRLQTPATLFPGWNRHTYFPLRSNKPTVAYYIAYYMAYLAYSSILFYFISFYFILFYFILFYFILFYFIGIELFSTLAINANWYLFRCLAWLLCVNQID